MFLLVIKLATKAGPYFSKRGQVMKKTKGINKDVLDIHGLIDDDLLSEEHAWCVWPWVLCQVRT
jgi:hypothetical protein